MPSAIREKGQYVIAFGVIAFVLAAAKFPIFVIFFFGIFAYFVWKMFSSTTRGETREVFEFYLAANDILRDDERRWFGFEMKEVIGRGESIIKNMTSPPPLVNFALGALYNKIGEHASAVRHLSYVVENGSADEKAVVFPSPELRNYVRVLRKIERDPAEAPLTSGAVRALERGRKNRARALLESSREMQRISPVPQERGVVDSAQEHGLIDRPLMGNVSSGAGNAESKGAYIASTDQKETTEPTRYAERKSISEVLHDIYDGSA